MFDEEGNFIVPEQDDLDYLLGLAITAREEGARAISIPPALLEWLVTRKPPRPIFDQPIKA